MRAVSSAASRGGKSTSTPAPAASADEILPPGWFKCASRSKPGCFYYAHPATKRTQVEPPPGTKRRAPTAPVVAPAPAEKAARTEANGKAAPAKAVQVVDSEETAEQKRERKLAEEEAKKRAEQRRKEEEARRKKADEEAKKREEEEAEAEEEARRALFLKAREKAREKQLLEEQADVEEEETKKQVKDGDKKKKEEKKDDTAEEANKSSSEEEGDDLMPKKSATIRRASIKAEWAKGQNEKRKTWKEDDDSEIEDEKVTREDLERWREEEEERERLEQETERKRKNEEQAKVRAEEERKRQLEAEEEASREAEYQAALKAAGVLPPPSADAASDLPAPPPAAGFDSGNKARGERSSSSSSSRSRRSKRRSRSSSSERPIPPSTEDPAFLQAELLKKLEGDEFRRNQPPKGFHDAPLPGAPAAPGQLPFEPPAPPPPRQPSAAAQFQHQDQHPPSHAHIPPPPPPPAPVVRVPAPPPQTVTAAAPAGRQTGTILWYNGRRRTGLLQPDIGGQLLEIPVNGAPNSSLAPPVPGGLMHGTRVTYQVAIDPARNVPMCIDVRPLDGQVGLSCGGESNAGARAVNEDRTIAVDLHEGLGHMVAIFDGHRGTCCAEFLVQNLPKVIQAKCTELFRANGLQPGAPKVSCCTPTEVSLMNKGLSAGFEAADQAYSATATQNGWGDGASALVALVAHGFDAPEEASKAYAGAGTVPTAPGGYAKLFAAWCGRSRMLLLRGRQAIRCTEDHSVSRNDEWYRLENLGACLVQDINGVCWMGPANRREQAWARQQGYEDSKGTKAFLATSRGFGDITMKGNAPVLVATPEVRAYDLTTEDWAIVLAGRGICSVLSDQDVATACWEAAVLQGMGPVETAKMLADRASGAGAKDNLTVIVMRLGWANPPPASAVAHHHYGGGW
eukprot:TRINITY_DN2568_c0_g1_i1.p1 TRINITY_DN2568_c0_g1~~TRINITY_DN2568_c0_g1_i1.p1  ORF type:complete len:910 (+),score=242.11 TRINITY_DN2568_c0_g1_i1:200-2929(+)